MTVISFYVIYLAALLFIILPLLTFAGHHDYSSKGGEFTVLKGIRLDVRKLRFVEKRTVIAEQSSLDASVFSFVSTVTIQTKESYVGNYSTFEDLDLEYELIVGLDKANGLHDKLISEIHQFWSTNPRDNSVTYDKNVTWRGDSYLIFSGSVYPDLVWFDGRFVQLKFLRFLDKKKSGLGAEQGFWEKKIRFYDNKTQLKLEYLVNGLQDEFLRLEKAGKFDRSAKAESPRR